jgi:hypothetical protein
MTRSCTLAPQDVNLSAKSIERRILTLRGQKMMLDRDLADLYGVTTRELVQVVRSRYEITCPFIGISLRLLMPFPEFLRSSYSLTTA